MKKSHILYFIRVAVVSISYFILAKYGLELDAVSRYATLIWAPAGIALAAILFYGYSLWPAVFIGAFSINLVEGTGLPAAVGIAFGNTVAAILAAYLLDEGGRFHRSFDRIRDVVAFLILACGLSTLVSATIGLISLWVGHVTPIEDVFSLWKAWWEGDALGTLVVTPFLLVWGGKPKITLKLLPVLEGTALALCLGTLSYVLFLSSYVNIPILTLPYVLFPLVLWSALRFDQKGTALVTFVIAAVATYGTAVGHGPFSQGSLRENLLLLHGFLLIMASTGLTVAAVFIERNQAVADRESAVLARDEFLSIASHELKTPLTSLTLQIQMTKNKIDVQKNLHPPIDKIARVFDVAERQVMRLGGLVEELLDVSRIQTGKFSFNFERENISEIVQDMVERFSDQFKKANCQLDAEIEDNLVGHCDHGRIEQVLDNLFSNAIKYACGHAVKISLSGSQKNFVLVVEDHGPGIPLEMQEKVFERFERASNSKNVTGLGLGLFIVREIIKGHEGSVRLFSDIGKGSKFVISLPMSRA